MAKKKAEEMASPDVQSNNFDDIALLVSEINKKYKNIIKSGTEMSKIYKIPFRVPVLDYVYDGGVPIGRVIEKLGKDHTFKTTESLMAVKMFQDYCFNCNTPDALTTFWETSNKGTPIAKSVSCKNCSEPRQTIQVFLDLEGTTDKDFMQNVFGIDIAGVIYARFENVSQAGNFLDAFTRMRDIGLIVVDSFGATGTDKERGKGVEEAQMNDNARITNMIMRKISGSMNANANESKDGQMSTTLYIINRQYQETGKQFTSYNAQGGHGLKHAKTISTENKLSSKVFDEETGKTLGKIIKITNTKNKSGVPDRKAEFFINQDKDNKELPYLGFDIKEQYFDFGLLFGVIKKTGAWYEFESVKAQGKIKFLAEVDYGKLKVEIDKLIY